MRGNRVRIAIAAGFLGLIAGYCRAQTVAPAGPQPPAVHPAHRHGKATPKPSPVPAPDPPPRPLTPEEMPPTPPQVNYNNGLLSIVASNSTLADILRAVTMRTGATVDAPSNLLSARIAARIGPGTPREVLTDLLRGPQLDYILVGAENDPNGIRSIILTAATNAAGPNSPAVSMVRPGGRGPAPPQEEVEEEVAPEETAEPEPPPPQAQPPQRAGPPFAIPPQGPGQFGPQAVEPPPSEAGPQQPGGGPQQPQVKTPEQLLEQLRKLQQGNPDNQPNRPDR
jgi:hypothetical protein